MENQPRARLIVERHAAHAAHSWHNAGPFGSGVRDKIARRELVDEALDVAAGDGGLDAHERDLPFDPHHRAGVDERVDSRGAMSGRRAQQFDERRLGRCRGHRGGRLRWLKLQWRTRSRTDSGGRGKRRVRLGKARRLRVRGSQRRGGQLCFRLRGQGRLLLCCHRRFGLRRECGFVLGCQRRVLRGACGLRFRDQQAGLRGKGPFSFRRQRSRLRG